MRTIVVVVAMLLTACGNGGQKPTGPSSAPLNRSTTPTIPPAAPVIRAGVGETVRAAGIEITVQRVTFDPCLGHAIEASPGHTFAIVDVVLRNTRDRGDPVDYGGLAWALQDGAGRNYVKAAVVDACLGVNGGPSLRPGVEVRTRLPFEVPGDVRGLVLRYDGLDSVGTVVIFDLGE